MKRNPLGDNLNWQAISIFSVLALVVSAVIKTSATGVTDNQEPVMALYPLVMLVLIFILGVDLRRRKRALILTAMSALSGLLLFFPLAGVPWQTPLVFAVLALLLL
jgi:hypothetical protein